MCTKSQPTLYVTCNSEYCLYFRICSMVTRDQTICIIYCQQQLFILACIKDLHIYNAWPEAVRCTGKDEEVGEEEKEGEKTGEGGEDGDENNGVRNGGG